MRRSSPFTVDFVLDPAAPLPIDQAIQDDDPVWKPPGTQGD